MINFLLAALLVSLFIFDWLFFVIGVGGRIMTWIPEFIALFIAVAIPFKTAVDKQSYIPFKYGVLIFVYLLHLLIGFLLNDITGWTMLAGLRIYTKFIPIFLAPLIFPFSEKAFKKFLVLIFAITMVQLPVVLWQRFIAFASWEGGDPMGGTLGISTSGVLAIYMISIIGFLIAFYFKGQISLPFFLLSAAAAFIPITLNETKITVVLLPIAFIFPAVFVREKAEVVFRVLLATTLMLVALIGFKTTYDYFAHRGAGGIGLVEWATDEQEFEEYTQRRIDPIVASVTVAPKKDLRFALFGRGAGNVSEGFTRILNGKYLNEAYRYDVEMTFPQLMWEIGFLGTGLFFLFPALVFSDAVRVSKEQGIAGAYGLGMLTYTIFFVLSAFYTYTIDSNVLIFMYFLAAGQLARLAAESREKHTETSALEHPWKSVVHPV